MGKNKVEHLDEGKRFIQEIIDDVQSRLDSGEIEQMFLVSFDGEGSWTSSASGRVNNYAVAASVLQSKFTEHQFE